MLVVSFIEICWGHVSAAGGANFAFDDLGLALGLVDGLDLRKKRAFEAVSSSRKVSRRWRNYYISNSPTTPNYT